MKNSFLGKDRDIMLLDFYGGGLLRRWMDDIVGKRDRGERLGHVMKLSLMELGGIFEIYGILIFFQLYCFHSRKLPIFIVN